MSSRMPADLAASVRQKLLNYSRKKKEDFNFVITRYSQERLLYRLSKSEFADDFVLRVGLCFLCGKRILIGHTRYGFAWIWRELIRQDD